MDAQIKFDQFHSSHLNLDGLLAQEILDLIIKTVDNDFLNQVNQVPIEQLLKFTDLFKDRSRTLADMAMHLKSICFVPKSYDSEYLDELITDKTVPQMELLIKKLEALPVTFEWNEESVTEVIKAFSKEFDIKIAYVAHIIRLSLIGKSDGPGMYKMLSILSKDDVIKRLKKFRFFIIDF